jgi:hypothetical protein
VAGARLFAAVTATEHRRARRAAGTGPARRVDRRDGAADPGRQRRRTRGAAVPRRRGRRRLPARARPVPLPGPRPARPALDGRAVRRPRRPARRGPRRHRQRLRGWPADACRSRGAPCRRRAPRHAPRARPTAALCRRLADALRTSRCARPAARRPDGRARRGGDEALPGRAWRRWLPGSCRGPACPTSRSRRCRPTDPGPVALRRRGRWVPQTGPVSFSPGALAVGVGLGGGLPEGPLQRLQPVAQRAAWMPRSGRAAVTRPARR